MKQYRTFTRLKGKSDDDWSISGTHDSMEDAITNAADMHRNHPDIDIVVLVFAHCTSAFWTGRVCWESPGVGAMNNG